MVRAPFHLHHRPVSRQAVAAFVAARLRATSAAAAAPNSRIIGGAGTGAGGPPDDPVLPEELPDELLELDEDDDPELLPPDDPVLVEKLPLLVEDDPVEPVDPPVLVPGVPNPPLLWF